MDPVEKEARRRAAQVKASPRDPSATGRVISGLILLAAAIYGALWASTQYYWPRVFPATQAGETRNDVLIRMGPPTGSRLRSGAWKGWGTDQKTDDAAQTDAWRTLPPGPTTVYVVQYDDLGVVLKSFKNKH
ncbi:MAG TPA: hypothetical protein VGO93_14705 [Candidatus Xenobia bacterium]|jgi:hypothetical protein